MTFYFEKFEDRKPPEPLKNSIVRENIWQFLATCNIIFGSWYIIWRWNHSINYDNFIFSIILIFAETFSFIGLVFFIYNLWSVNDYEIKPPPKNFSECINNPSEDDNRPVRVDLFIATYSEEEELVRLSIKDAKNIKYPHNIDLQIHILDDGRRPSMKQVCDEEGINYITRNNNIGFKAGNMRNAMEKTFGDFIVICDADTRVFPTILENTMGYFKDPDVAWVQTPQWFYDIPEGEKLRFWLKKKIGFIGYYFGLLIESIFGDIMIGADPFVNDPKLFYDVILRRRNGANASFCCGAGSIHRREAVMEASLKAYSEQISKFVAKETKSVPQELKKDLEEVMTKEVSLDTEHTPYKFHVSEDIYTSIVLHSDPDRNWKSVLHPSVESKMLSPQDLYSWSVQRFKYAGGTLDIALNDNPIFREGLSHKQKLMYGATVWSYFSGIWNVIFLVYPIIYMFTAISPVSANAHDFYIHALPFFITNEISFMIGTWGINSFPGKAGYLSFFPLNLMAIWTVLKGEKIKFPVTPKDRQEGNFFKLVIPQFLIILFTFLGIIYSFSMYFIGKTENLTGIFVNSLWGINNIFCMAGIVYSAFWKPEEA
ncbi:MAG: cellulose synthase catalytic subunit [Candidatus Sericytochromatia bacterium]